MSALRIGFDAMEWQEVRDGVRQKVYCEGSRQLRLMEFGECGGEEWCIPAGATTRHRGLNIHLGTRLLMVEDL